MESNQCEAYCINNPVLAIVVYERYDMLDKNKTRRSPVRITFVGLCDDENRGGGFPEGSLKCA